MQVRVAHTLTNCVNANEGTRGQKVLALDITRTLGIHLRPLAVGVIGEELQRVQLLTGVAALGLVRALHGDRTER